MWYNFIGNKKSKTEVKKFIQKFTWNPIHLEPLW